MTSKEESKQHLIDIMKGDEELGLYEYGQEVVHSDQVEETWECYEINIVQSRIFGCNKQCKECKAEKFKKQ